ncbi:MULTISPECIES: ubiquitin-like protein [Coprobacillaceae]|uniref:ubiquitin-like protein n=1 Tax=Coprobacillaceae TaxID=2810280 RepID=UPI000E4BB38D|nr:MULTISPECIES: ubiquitin-like protein [Coprobacillaceae]RHM63584.1 hypothetical protein DWZ53_00370 [Coprobacillus sp. AF33-1AC]RHS96313.1 hypothetical protein DW911_00370 [Erysipelatoclostridium sp. AM42-17]
MKKRFFRGLLTCFLVLGINIINVKGMELYVDLAIVGEKTLKFEVESGDSIDNIKHYIFNKTSIPSSIQTLSFHNKILNNGRTLADYNIQKQSTITLNIMDAKEVSTSQELVSAIDNNYTRIQLTSDIVLDHPLDIDKGLLLDLNGHILTCKNENIDDRIISVHSDAELTIKDSQPDATHPHTNIKGGIVSGSHHDQGSAISIDRGFCHMLAGTIANCQSKKGAVYIGEYSSFMMAHDAKIEDCHAGGNFAGAIYIDENGTFTMNGGSISNCTSMHGGIYNKGTFNANDGIIDCRVTNDGSIYCTGSSMSHFKDNVENRSIIQGGIFYKLLVLEPGSHLDGYTITYQNDKNHYARQVIPYHQKAIMPFMPSLDGYIFDGWYQGDTLYNFNQEVSSDLTLIAKWQCNHDYSWKNVNGQYWKECNICHNKTAKQTIPEIFINGKDKVCKTQNYIFSFSLPLNCKNPTYSYIDDNNQEVSHIPELKNGVYTGNIDARLYQNLNQFRFTLNAETNDGFKFTTVKIFSVQSHHSGGQATCITPAICETCGLTYGSVDSQHHTNLQHVKAKPATYNAVGYKEHWYCKDCHKYFLDDQAKTEVNKESLVIHKYVKTGDENNHVFYVCLLIMSLLTILFLFIKNKKNV